MISSRRLQRMLTGILLVLPILAGANPEPTLEITGLKDELLSEKEE